MHVIVQIKGIDEQTNMMKSSWVIFLRPIYIVKSKITIYNIDLSNFDIYSARGVVAI